jgi:HAD superfamily hydrolase (TIGR01484 family)
METIGVKPLPPPDSPAAVLSFDFDGTLHDPASEPPVPRACFDLLRRLRASHNIVWGINTGRTMDHLLEGFAESHFPFLPDWAVACEREIHLSDADGRWREHDSWNHRCRHEISALFERAARLLARIRREIEERTGAEWFELQHDPACIVARTTEEMDWIVGHITPIAAEVPELGWQRSSIYLRFGHREFQKGTSLGEVARLHGLTPETCFAMGDSHNDLEMLDAKHAAMAACPANAVAEIIAKVESSGGLVTRLPHGHGVVEALRHYFER